MKRISGFSQACKVLTRKAQLDFGEVSPSLARKLMDMFGSGSPWEVVAKIVEDVRKRGDKAILDFTSKIDGIGLEFLEIDRKKIVEARENVDENLISALELASQRIRSFHEIQKNTIGRGFQRQGLGQALVPLERVGIYAPGGTATYPSTVLMAAIPARVAGVKEIILASSPKSGGMLAPATLLAAEIAGVDRVFCIGGAQAIAALAFGTDSIPKVDKICGPGNIFVVLAKKMVYGTVDIDGLQGPSEVIIVADSDADPTFCAADILAQAEHDIQASSIMITTSEELALEVEVEVERQLQSLSRKDIITESLNNGGMIVTVSNLDEAIELANLYAPEHLCLIGDKAHDWVKRINNAGCIFVGNKATVVLGDYIAGPSHVLPTGGTARFGSPLSVADFIKFINFVSLDEDEIGRIGPAAAIIARAEGFEAHARAIERRLG